MKGVMLQGYDPPSMSILAPQITSDLGGGLFPSHRRWHKSYHEFRYNFVVQRRERADEFRHVVRHLQGDTEFYFDGGEWGDLTEPIHIAYGDGSKSQFELPDADVLASSFVLYNNKILEPRWTLDADAGMVTTGFVPASGDELTALYKRLFRCKIISTGDSRELMTEVDSFKFRSTGEIRFREVP